MIGEWSSIQIGLSTIYKEECSHAECIEKQSENAEDHYWLRFDHSRLEGYQGSCFRHFYHLEAPKTVAFLTQAQKALKDALAHLSPSMMQRRPALLIDLASTYTLQREFEEACEYAIQAIIILAQIQSRTGMQRLLTLRQDLALWRDTSYVKKVDEYIEALLVPEWRRSVWTKTSQLRGEFSILSPVDALRHHSRTTS